MLEDILREIEDKEKQEYGTGWRYSGEAQGLHMAAEIIRSHMKNNEQKNMSAEY